MLLRCVFLFCDLMHCSTPGSSVHGHSPGKNTGVGCHALLQGIFPTQGLNPGLPNCRQILYQLSYQGSCIKKKIYIYIYIYIFFFLVRFPVSLIGYCGRQNNVPPLSVPNLQDVYILILDPVNMLGYTTKGN